MGYWNPPSLFAFDPHERPLCQMQQFGKAVPCDLDRALFGSLSRWPPGKTYGGEGAYWLMVAARAPEDPPMGGLPPDTINADGSVTIHYFDMADAHVIWRKRVTYRADPKTGAPQIVGDVPDLFYKSRANPIGAWQKEGWDAERDLSRIGVDILSAIGTIAAVALSFTGAGAAFSAAFSAMWSLTLRQLRGGGRPPDVSEVLSAVSSVAGAMAPGVWSIASKSPELSAIFRSGTISALAKLPGTYQEKIAAFANQLKAALPRINIPATVPGYTLPAWARGDLVSKIPTVPTVNTSVSALLPPIGPPGKEVKLSELGGSERWAFDWAMRAFVDPDPLAHLLQRRNYMWLGVDNSTAISPGEGSSLAARNVVEVDDGLVSAGAFYDQYLAALDAQMTRDLEAGASIGLITALESTRKADKAAQERLLDLLSTLKQRYRM
jgi:hypothetical protein